MVSNIFVAFGLCIDISISHKNPAEHVRLDANEFRLFSLGVSSRKVNNQLGPSAWYTSIISVNDRSAATTFVYNKIVFSILFRYQAVFINASFSFTKGKIQFFHF